MGFESALQLLTIALAVSLWVGRGIARRRRRQIERMRGGPEFERAYEPIEPPSFGSTRATPVAGDAEE